MNHWQISLSKQQCVFSHRFAVLQMCIFSAEASVWAFAFNKVGLIVFGQLATFLQNKHNLRCHSHAAWYENGQVLKNQPYVNKNKKHYLTVPWWTWNLHTITFSNDYLFVFQQIICHVYHLHILQKVSCEFYSKTEPKAIWSEDEPPLPPSGKSLSLFSLCLPV